MSPVTPSAMANATLADSLSTFPLPSFFAGTEELIHSMLSAYMLGTFFSLPLYGLTIHQLYRYYRLGFEDSSFVRILVIVVMVTETFHTVLSMCVCYVSTVTDYGNPLLFQKPVSAVVLMPVASSMIIMSSELFFTRRVSLLSPAHSVVAAIAMALLLAQFAIGIALTNTIGNLHFKGLSTSLLPSRWMYPTFFGCATAADLLLSGSLIIAMRRSRGQHEKNDTLFDTFVIYVVNTGLLTGIANGVPFIWALAQSEDFGWSAFNFVACKLYANTLLSVLNSRKRFLGRGMEVLYGKSIERNIIARAQRRDAMERWNLPEVNDTGSLSSDPIKVDVATVTESHSDAMVRRPDGATPRELPRDRAKRNTQKGS